MNVQLNTTDQNKISIFKFLSLLNLKRKYFTENIAFNGMRGDLVFPNSIHIHEHKLSIIKVR